MQHELKVKEMDRVLEMKKLDYNHEEAIQVCTVIICYFFERSYDF